jgi:hypothetical protein
MGLAARQRVQQHFALHGIVERYESIYSELAAETRPRIPQPSLSQCSR